MPALKQKAPPRLGKKARRSTGTLPAHRFAKKFSSTPAPFPWVAQIDRLQFGFQLNQIELAQLLNCAPRSLILWKNRRPPNPAVLVRLKELDRLYHALAELMPPADVGAWMKRTNDYLDPLTPLEVLSRGEIDRLWHIIHNVATGMPT